MTCMTNILTLFLDILHIFYDNLLLQWYTMEVIIINKYRAMIEGGIVIVWSHMIMY